MFDPAGLRPFVANWEAVAEALVQRVHREALGGGAGPRRFPLSWRRSSAIPECPRGGRPPDLLSPFPKPLTSPFSSARETSFRDFFSTVTTLGTPLDVTLQEIRIECFFPADEQTAEAARQLAAASRIEHDYFVRSPHFAPGSV